MISKWNALFWVSQWAWCWVVMFLIPGCCGEARSTSSHRLFHLIFGFSWEKLPLSLYFWWEAQAPGSHVSSPTVKPLQEAWSVEGRRHSQKEESRTLLESLIVAIQKCYLRKQYTASPAPSPAQFGFLSVATQKELLAYFLRHQGRSTVQSPIRQPPLQKLKKLWDVLLWPIRKDGNSKAARSRRIYLLHTHVFPHTHDGHTKTQAWGEVFASQDAIPDICADLCTPTALFLHCPSQQFRWYIMNTCQESCQPGGPRRVSKQPVLSRKLQCQDCEAVRRPLWLKRWDECSTDVFVKGCSCSQALSLVAWDSCLAGCPACATCHCQNGFLNTAVLAPLSLPTGWGQIPQP